MGLIVPDSYRGKADFEYLVLSDKTYDDHARMEINRTDLRSSGLFTLSNGYYHQNINIVFLNIPIIGIIGILWLPLYKEN